MKKLLLSFLSVLSLLGPVNITAAPPNQEIDIVEDFLSIFPAGSMFVSNYAWLTNDIVLWWQNVGIFPGHPGVISNARLDNTGIPPYGVRNYTYIALAGPNYFSFGVGALSANYVLNLEILSDATNSYTLRVGVSDSFNSDATEGCYFRYSDTPGTWELVSASGGVSTVVDSGITVTPDWHNLGISVNADATSVTYTIDGVIAGTITTNISTSGVFPQISLVRNAGIIAGGNVAVDLFYLNQLLTTPR